uniref:Cyclin N-terminal domain-containing protein n=1 Tax=Spongospora subterranea TaxID=70186 RepID=A0A0H5QKK3_9EUKA|eukprot:CRZ01831.1 hypothetical protein [Spongospora subterranea]
MLDPSMEAQDTFNEVLLRPSRVLSAQEFMKSIPLERPRLGVPFIQRESQSFIVRDRLMSCIDPTSAYPEPTEQENEPVPPPPPPQQQPKKKPLFANCPSQGTGQTRSQWQRSMTPHLIGSRIYIARYGGSPILVTSTIRPVPTERDRKASVDLGDHLHDIDALLPQPGQTGVSYRTLLDSSTDQFLSLYSPRLLDDPEAKLGSNRLVMNLPCYMSSVIAFVRSKDLRLDLNRQFSVKHPWLHQSMTLSKIRRIKANILRVIHDLDMEISTAAIACAYFEMLIIKGVVNKQIRHTLAAVCVLLASKFNACGRDPGELLQELCEMMRIRRQSVLDLELYVFVQLEFNLHLTPSQILPHFSNLLQSLDSDVVDYLGKQCYEQFCHSLGLEAQ